MGDGGGRQPSRRSALPELVVERTGQHSTRQIAEVLERLTFLNDLGLDRHLGELNDTLVRRYARRMATRPPSISARI